MTVHIEQRASADLRERATGAALSVRRVREVHNVRSVVVDGGRTELSLHVKLPADETLSDAHRISDAVERAIREAVPEVAGVHVHLEPLARAIEVTVPPPDELAALRAGLERIALDVTGRPAREVLVHREPRGNVAYLTIELPGGDTLARAHEIAARIEARAEGTLADVAEVVVHTEPARRRLDANEVDAGRRADRDRQRAVPLIAGDEQQHRAEQADGDGDDPGDAFERHRPYRPTGP